VIENCGQCGLPIRLGALRVKVNGRQGITHYLDHIGRTECRAHRGFTSVAFKAYPEPRPYQTMIAEWNYTQAMMRDPRLD
jgi:hypothetical protein